MNAFRLNIRRWAAERGIDKCNDYGHKQAMKFVEEMGEFFGATLKNDRDKQIDSIGDMLVVLEVLALQTGSEIRGGSAFHGISPMTQLIEDAFLLVGNAEIEVNITDEITECYACVLACAENAKLDPEQAKEHAWAEIKDRTGKTVNGVFVRGK
jgi:NTP pyrophosphatase (non-canonical NTP hydrolase)